MGLALPKQEPAVFAKPKGDERQRIIRMRTALVMGSPFYGLLAMKLKVVEEAACRTAATDAKSLFYNPAYIAGMSDAKLRGLIGHETLHCCMGHAWRQGAREHRLWNIACDYAIDQILVRGKFDVPNALVNPAWAGWSAEQIYAALLDEVEKQRTEQKQQGQGAQGEPGEDEDGGEEKPQGGDGSGAGADDGSGNRSYHQAIDKLFGNGPTKGEVRQAPVATAIQDQADWKTAISAAAQVAKSQGKLPSEMEIIVNEALQPRVDWKALLRRFVQMCARMDYTWRSPSPRHQQRGFYLPRLKSEQMPPIVIAVDTSGSIGGAELKQFAGEVSSIIEEANPECAHLVFCDAAVHGTHEFLPGDPITFKPTGGGGTSFVPVFDWIEDQGIEPACLIYLTDMFGSCQIEEPPYPVIWASTTKPEKIGDHYTPAFGEIIYLDFE